jgi:transcriptional regulator with XRE-family HTH domain
MVPIVPLHCWVARTALGWTLTDLARAAEVSPGSVRRFEHGGALRATTAEAIQGALARAGVIWVDAKDGGPGARLQRAE